MVDISVVLELHILAVNKRDTEVCVGGGESLPSKTFVKVPPKTTEILFYYKYFEKRRLIITNGNA